MKTHIIILLFIMSLFTACNEDVYISPYKGEAYMDWAGGNVEYIVRVTSNTQVKDKERFDIEFNFKTNNGKGHSFNFNKLNLNKNINIVYLNNIEGISEDSVSSSLYLSMTGASDAFYRVAKNYNSQNYVKIIAYNSNLKELKGEFSMTYVRDFTRPFHSDAPDTLSIKNGTFFVKLE